MRRKRRNSFIRRNRKLGWILGVSAVVVALLYWEQAAVLYVLSTLVMCALLLVVAFSNLEARDREFHQAALAEPVPRNPESYSASKQRRVA